MSPAACPSAPGRAEAAKGSRGTQDSRKGPGWTRPSGLLSPAPKPAAELSWGGGHLGAMQASSLASFQNPPALPVPHPQGPGLCHLVVCADP